MLEGMKNWPRVRFHVNVNVTVENASKLDFRIGFLVHTYEDFE